jgi:hypothetical protein
MSPRLDEAVRTKKAMRPNRRDGIANPIAAVSTAAIVEAIPIRRMSSPISSCWLEIVEIAKLEEQQSRGGEDRSLGPKCTLPNPIDFPISQRHGCEQYHDVTDEDEEKLFEM